MSELKPLPCPHCGSEAKAESEIRLGMEMHSVWCANDDCPMALMHPDLESAIRGWNQRQPHPDEELAEQFRLGFEAGRKDAMRQQAMEQEQLEGLE